VPPCGWADVTVPLPPIATDPAQPGRDPARDANAHNGVAAVAGSNGYTAIDNGAPPAAVDSDTDGLTDDFEKLALTNPLSADSDADGLTDGFEALHSHTDPLSADTDKDGIGDAAEVTARSDAGSIPGIAGVSGLGDHAQNVRGGVLDTDLDGLSDQFEAQVGSNPTVADSDLDELPDSLEVTLGTDPTMLDTDGDGITDGIEVTFGSNPLEQDAGTGYHATTVPAPLVPVPAVPAAAPVPASTPATPAARGQHGGSGSVQHLIDVAMAQVGDDYVYGVEVAETDPDPQVWDCAEFTQWSAYQVGAEIPGSSQAKTPERQQQDITASTTGSRQTIQQGGKNVVIEKQQDGSWKTIGEAEIPASSQAVTPERAQQEAARTAQSQRVTIQLDGKNVEMQQQADGSWKPIGQAPVSTAQQEAGLAGQKAFDTERGKQVAERVAGYQKAAGEAQQAIDALTTMRRVQQDTPTGPLAPHLTAYGALASSLGINLGPIAQGLSPQSVAGAQAFSKLSAGLATHLIGANGFPSNSFSNADRQFVESMVPNLTNTPNANLLIGAFMQAQAQRVQQRATDYAAIKTKTPDSVEAWEQQWTRNNNANPIFREVSTPDEAKALPPNTIYHVKGQPLDKAWGLIGSGG